MPDQWLNRFGDALGEFLDLVVGLAHVEDPTGDGVRGGRGADHVRRRHVLYIDERPPHLTAVVEKEMS